MIGLWKHHLLSTSPSNKDMLAKTLKNPTLSQRSPTRSITYSRRVQKAAQQRQQKSCCKAVDGDGCRKTCSATPCNGCFRREVKSSTSQGMGAFHVLTGSAAHSRVQTCLSRVDQIGQAHHHTHPAAHHLFKLTLR